MSLLKKGINNVNSNFTFKFIKMQLLRIICPMRDFQALIYSCLQNCGSNMNYSHILIFVSTPVNMTRDQNSDLFDRYIEFCDNGVLTIGSYVRISVPMLITPLMNNKMPMVKPKFPTIALCHLPHFEEIPMSIKIKKDYSLAFIPKSTSCCKEYICNSKYFFRPLFVMNKY
mmetsp:Transcript_22798/g.30178  ORF Transcript_22798/g.30178 Transcript_22798/m.30178 type:complete len:171 (-) Transcript_22798:302-814(-)